MFKRNLIAVWLGIILLSGMFLLGQDTWPSPCTDNDGDGYGNPASTSCIHPEPDCDDSNVDIHPGAPELCDGMDNQCPDEPGYGEVDEGCYRLVWVTETLTEGNIGGLAGADAICQAEAAEAGIEGTFMAWLSTSEASPATRFTREGYPWFCGNGERFFARDWDHLTGGQFQSEICDLSLTGSVPIPIVGIWTGTDSTGHGGVDSAVQCQDPDSVSCSDWTSSDPNLTAEMGSITHDITEWTSLCELIPWPECCGHCDEPKHLYCFEQ